MPSRQYVVGSSPQIHVDAGALTGGFSTFTIAVVCKAVSQGAGSAALFTIKDGTPNYYEWTTLSGTMQLGSPVGNSTPPVLFAESEGWCILAVTKAAGSTAPRFHKCVLSTGVWTHGVGDNPVGDQTITTTDVQIGESDGEYFGGSILCEAVWLSNLASVSDAALEAALAASGGWAGWLAQSPSAAWALDQASTATAVTDATGHGSDQTSTSGTGVDADVPAQFAMTSAAGFTNTVLPTLTGTLNIGGTLTVNPGTWTPTPGSYHYGWYRADDAAGTNVTRIAPATAGTYTLDAADNGKYIDAVVIPET